MSRVEFRSQDPADQPPVSRRKAGQRWIDNHSRVLFLTSRFKTEEDFDEKESGAV